MKKTLIAAAILALLTTVVCIDRITSTANPRQSGNTRPVATLFSRLGSENEPAVAARPGDRKKAAGATPASFQPGDSGRELRRETVPTRESQNPGENTQTPSGVRTGSPPGAVLPMELVIETTDSGRELQSTFSNKSPLLIAIRYDGELFRLERWMSKTLDVAAKPASLDVFVWGIVNGREEWQAVYATLLDPKPGALHLPLEFQGTPVKPAGPPPTDEEP
ncbi:MAG: hypothetical protein J0M04_13690 [Verrucomicrobia bacterium]|nr:hypothetical protein [Verrucomicrobiota bacterium]